MPQEPSAAEIHGRDFPAGAVAFEEGDPGSRTYAIVRGAAQLEERAGRSPMTLALLGAGELLREERSRT